MKLYKRKIENIQSIKPPSKARIKYLKEQKSIKTAIFLSRWLILTAFFALWELLASFKIIDAFLFSSPSRIINTLKNLSENGDLTKHVFTTLSETVAGFIAATLFGTATAMLLWWFQPLKKTLEPYIIVLNALPKIALGPVIIIAFGSGVKSIIFMTIIVTVIVTIINMSNAYDQTEKGKILLLRSLGANKLTVLTKLVIPASAPAFFSTLKVNVGLSWIGSIMGEYIVSRQGLGYLIVYGGQVLNLDLVMTSTILLCVLASLMYLCVILAEKLTLSRR